MIQVFRPIRRQVIQRLLGNVRKTRLDFFFDGPSRSEAFLDFTN